MLADKIISVPNGGHDIYEQIWGWSQFGGALLALFALVAAIAAWRYAKRAADAANESVQLAREELHMLKDAASRRPALELTVYEVPSSQPRSGAFQIGVRNSGTADAENAIITIVAPVDVHVLISNRSDFTGETNQFLEPTTEYLAGVASLGYATQAVTVRREQSAVTWVRVQPLSVPSTVPVRIKVNHPDADELFRVITLVVS